MTDLIDAIINVDPEPCETCDTGIQYIVCWDGRGRCRNCVQEMARKLGWDRVELESEEFKKRNTPKPISPHIQPRMDPQLDL